MERIPADALESLDFGLLSEDKPKDIQRIAMQLELKLYVPINNSIYQII